MTLNDIASGLEQLAREYDAKMALSVRTEGKISYDRGVVFGIMKSAELIRTGVRQMPGIDLGTFDGGVR